MLRSFRLSTIGLIYFATTSSLHGQFTPALSFGGPAPNAAGDFIRDFCRYPHESSRDNTFSMTRINIGASDPRANAQAIPEMPPY
jgi:hypothetical protein